MKFKNIFSALICFVSLTSLCLSIGWLVQIIAVNYSNKIDSNGCVAAVIGATVSFLTTIIFKYIVNLKNACNLEKYLLTEMGFIARALYYNLSITNNNFNESLQETLIVSNAIYHNLGNDIFLLNNNIASDIIEFHSQIKVLNNILNIKKTKNSRNDQLNKKDLVESEKLVMKQITNIVEKYQEVQNIISQANKSKKNYKFWLSMSNKQF